MAKQTRYGPKPKPAKDKLSERYSLRFTPAEMKKVRKLTPQQARKALLAAAT